jgi:ferrous iron transport protein B
MNFRQFLNSIKFNRKNGSCHGSATELGSKNLKTVLIIGTPNVGKSVIFNRLTGVYVTVSNYPGTTVDVSRGIANIDHEKIEVIDTPGMYSLLPITEEERVARLLLLETRPWAVLHVIDARNLERMLPFTMQLIEAGLPVILVINMMDELATAGMDIKLDELENQLQIPVIATVATTGRGINQLRRRLAGYVGHPEDAVTV